MGLLRGRDGSRERPRVRPLAAWFWMLLAAAAAAAAIWAVSWWLLGVAGKAPKPEQRVTARIDAVRTGLAAGAGAGAAVGLMLAFRRQRHQEIATALSDYDAAERRITDLYTKAADQLGSDKAPVRLAGLYALERLAQDTPGHRQTIVNLICAYLRMPYTPPDPDSDPAADPDGNVAGPDWNAARRRHQLRYQAARRGHQLLPISEPAAPAGPDLREERQVRLTAQRILHTHLQPTDRLRYWPGIDLDLTGATLLDFAFRDSVLATATFTGATFTGVAAFERAIFTGDARFDSATFIDGASFNSATFSSPADFNLATFSSVANYRSVTYRNWADFESATFTSGASFNSATFSSVAFFRYATFTFAAHFRSATFTDGARFTGATFTGHSDDTPTGVDLSGAQAQVASEHSWPPGWTLKPEPDGVTGVLAGAPIPVGGHVL